MGDRLSYGSDRLDVLSSFAHPHVRVLGRARSAFHVCGLVGLALAIALGTALTGHRGLPLWVFAAVVLTACATFLALAMATKILLGEERLIYYHHEIAILATVALVLHLLGRPVLAYLDVVMLAVGAFLLCGRVGCFMVGCCHGRPYRRGVRYRTEHAKAGFAPILVGVRLFPIQLVEAAWVLVTVTVGIGLVLRGAPAGAALAWYVVVYDIGRFGFEFARGDVRPYRSGFSEAQWTSLLLLLVVVALELGGLIPLEPWHLAAAAAMGLTMGGAKFRRRLHRRRHHLLNARHILEVAEAVDLLAAPEPDAASAIGEPHMVRVASTSGGLRISAGRTAGAEPAVTHYTMSAVDSALSEADAHAVAELLLQLRHADRQGELVSRHKGVFHLLVAPEGASHQNVESLAASRCGLREAALP